MAFEDAVASFDQCNSQWSDVETSRGHPIPRCFRGLELKGRCHNV